MAWPALDPAGGDMPTPATVPALTANAQHRPRFRHSLSILGLLLFVNFSFEQKDPVSNFCRRFGHQTAIVDDTLFIDGGLVNWNPIEQNPTNYSSKCDGH
jgi:hypothetical protein